MSAKKPVDILEEVTMPDEKKNKKEKPFACSICSATFSTRSARSRCKRAHRVANNEIKPHRCEKCTAPFARKDHLTKHLLTCGNKRKCSGKRPAPDSRVIKHQKYVTKKQLSQEMQLLRDHLATTAAQQSDLFIKQSESDCQTIKKNTSSIKIILLCHQCKRLFDSHDEIKEHAASCIERYGHILENPTFRASIIGHLIRDFENELTLPLLEYLYTEGDMNLDIASDVSPLAGTDNAVTIKIESNLGLEYESSESNSSSDYDVNDDDETSDSSSDSDSETGSDRTNSNDEKGSEAHSANDDDKNDGEISDDRNVENETDGTDSSDSETGSDRTNLNDEKSSEAHSTNGNDNNGGEMSDDRNVEDGTDGTNSTGSETGSDRTNLKDGKGSEVH